ncbi:MAG: RimK family alpha-L-glutamate ligase [Theionarchaea archaeon]|nr:RimK family alpha-L-glutamate ligase [Theionarchaea archaeon]MBU7001516.1 RimK family alpha-L-glutamate ligase [Theionarchaea archaeon]MBU7019711.1 RimK family alpha-L-glutamate ligase [Theionarchaea archaeon]MBU7034422.1 RimK family alpha-L-glutamate ligase [Theionarchaea archaeon]MBU7040633.1 RimK family alpha-L-glutamate ligase [Theionarchaea archaeon]
MIGIIASELDWNVRELMREIASRGKEHIVFPITEVLAQVSATQKVTWGNVIVDDMEAVFVRWVPGGSAEQVVFRMDVLHRLENLGIPIINPSRSIEQCADKYYTCSLLEDAGIPTPRTICTEHYQMAMDTFDELGDVVVKPLFGSQGLGVMRIQDRDLAHRLFHILDYGNCVFCIQEFIPHNNEDFRVFVIGDEAISSMKRRGLTWKTNFARGASVEKAALPRKVVDMAVAATNVVGCRYAGVDLLHGSGQDYVLEVNSIPGWKGLQCVTDFCIAEKIVAHFLG